MDTKLGINIGTKKIDTKRYKIYVRYTNNNKKNSTITNWK